ncbi:Uncharacterised protein [Anaerostipes hadrus]|nr:Uncharacterised protein [Anaerostipes hadrus]
MYELENDDEIDLRELFLALKKKMRLFQVLCKHKKLI